MRNLVLFMHQSLDGFVAGPKGEMDWIKVDDDLFSYPDTLTKNADTALYGRVTYQMMDAYWPTAADQADASAHDISHSRWYNQVEKIVVSETLTQAQVKNAKLISTNLVEEVKKLKALKGKTIIMFGSPGTAQSLIAEKLIDDFWLFVNPILLGEGIPLFPNLKDRSKLELKWSKTFSSGIVGLHYKLKS